MNLYLVRHGIAADGAVDPERGLTEKGREEVRRVAEFLRRAGVTVSEIRHSYKKRAEQTAEILAAAVAPGTAPRNMDGLAPNDPVEPLGGELSAWDRDLMLVGHFPHIPRLLAFLLTGGERQTPLTSFPEAGIACLKCDDDGFWRLGWMILPALLPTAGS